MFFLSNFTGLHLFRLEIINNSVGIFSRQIQTAAVKTTIKQITNDLGYFPQKHDSYSTFGHFKNHSRVLHEDLEPRALEEKINN